MLYTTLGDTGGKNFRAQAGQSRGQNITGAQQDIRTGMGQLAGAIGSHFAPKPGEGPLPALEANPPKQPSGTPGTDQPPAKGAAPGTTGKPFVPPTGSLGQNVDEKK